MHDWLEIWSRELHESPPADALVQLYFQAMKWWAPPETAAGEGSVDGEQPEMWECPLPDVTE